MLANVKSKDVEYIYIVPLEFDSSFNVSKKHYDIYPIDAHCAKSTIYVSVILYPLL